ncbi:uncharacterized protein LOC110672097 isoform X5 [Hevea brasiliensis]|uniref:uncharacterized protein LOC110672097 isoform X5 n=1 Tax=Hevea brasiliensis TaxID=3981 RepID=UPI0025F78F6A|nr:uncharacterized protein LOC110672097 isoform X5 [Hevea brasiliensis]
MIVIFKQLNFCPKMQQILELLAQMKIEGWIYWNWVPTVEFRLHEDFCCGYHAFLLRRKMRRSRRAATTPEPDAPDEVSAQDETPAPRRRGRRPRAA